MQERWRNVRDGWLTVNARELEQRQRGQLLGILLAGMCAAILALTAINVIELAVAPSSKQVFYVVGDVFTVLVLVGLWRLNRDGHTQSASYTLLALLVIGSSTLLSMRTLDRTLIIYAIPIMAASFLVRPGSSFVIALLSALGYSLARLVHGSASTYNYFSVLSLLIMAFLAWLIAARLEKDRIERKQAEEALRRRAQELTALQATVLDITSPHPLPVLLRIIVERAANLLNATSGGLYLTEPEHCRVRCVVSYNTPRDFTGTLLDYGEGAAGHVAQTGQPLVIDDYRAWSGRASAFEDERPFQAMISAPLLWRGSVTGVVHVLREASAGRFSQPDLDLLAMFANHAAVAVENARLHGALEQELAERRRAEAALRASERRFRVAAESLSDLIYEWDLEDSIEWYGDIDRRLGYPTGEYPRTLDGWAASLHPEDKERVWAAVEDQLERAAPYDVEYRARTRDGEWRWWSARGTALRDGGGEPYRWIGSITDITERKRVEGVLGLQSAALNATANAIVITDREGVIQWANPAFTALTGYTSAEAVGKNPRELVKSGQHDQMFYKDLWDTILAGQIWRGQLINRRKDGRLYAEEMTITPLQDERGQISHFIAIKQDITERKRAEEALGRQAEELAALQATVLEITTPHDLPHLLQIIVERAARLLNADGGSLYLCDPERREARCVVSYNTPRDYTGSVRKYGEGAAGSVAGSGEALIIDDYRTWPGRAAAFEAEQPFRSVVTAPMLWRGQVTGVIHTLRFAENHPFTLEDLELLTLFANHAAIATENARLLQGLQLELAERKRMDEQLRQTMAELERSNTELEQFAYVASHDLQEPLRMVTSYLQLIAQRYQGRLDADADEFIAYAVDGATRMHRLINDLLAYSRVGTRGKPFEPTDCESALDQALANLQIAIEETGAAATRDPLPAVVADEGQLVQLFQNLIGNACKFHGAEPPRIHVSAERQREAGGEWVFSVRDNGIGIEPQQFERIFMIFQRLHTLAEYPGTGIGLAMCKKIVGRHGGRIWVESQPGQGSTFYFTLPAQQTSAESDPA